MLMFPLIHQPQFYNDSNAVQKPLLMASIT